MQVNIMMLIWVLYLCEYRTKSSLWYMPCPWHGLNFDSSWNPSSPPPHTPHPSFCLCTGSLECLSTLGAEMCVIPLAEDRWALCKACSRALIIFILPKLPVHPVLPLFQCAFKSLPAFSFLPLPHKHTLSLFLSLSRLIPTYTEHIAGLMNCSLSSVAFPHKHSDKTLKTSLAFLLWSGLWLQYFC